MSVWYCIPSARPAAEANSALDLWRRQGYRIALWRDPGAEPIACDLLIQQSYNGYAVAVNTLIAAALELDPACDWTVTGGDDVSPDPNLQADEIARQCSEHFGLIHSSAPTFGVMQPTGDRWGEDPNLPNCNATRTAYADRVCCSPWIGREFCARVNGGNGPLWPEYTHMFVDEELQHVATNLGVLWQRRDLIHLHRHWARERRQIPQFLTAANSATHWRDSQALFDRRRANGFPGSQPLPVELRA